jgi:uncharacterized membrane protein YqjE
VDPQEPGPPPSPGPLESLRRLAGTLADAVGTRAELAFVEFREEGERRKALLVLGVVGGVFLAMGLLLLAFFVVVAFWDTYRLQAIGAMTLLYLGIGVGLVMRLRSRARSAPPPFSATREVLAADREALKARRD